MSSRVGFGPIMAKFIVSLALISMASAASASHLKVGFYKKTCPVAETIVRNTVKKVIASDPGAPAGLIRLLFHDCFVRGCEGSILLDSTPTNKAEKDSSSNLGVGGFDTVDEAKALIESHCPNTVSCADIIAFAARDSVHFAGGLYYPVKAGRRDGRHSFSSEADSNLPGAYFNVQQLKQNFAKKGLSIEDMVTLSGAHSIGDSHCSNFNKRLYSFNSTYAQDPSLDKAYAKQLRSVCPNPSKTTSDPTVHLDPVTPFKLDNVFYKDLKNNKGLLVSDQTLWNTPSTRPLVKLNADHPSVWAKKFVEAMERMGSIEVLTGTQGEIRKKCGVVN